MPTDPDSEAEAEESRSMSLRLLGGTCSSSVVRRDCLLVPGVSGARSTADSGNAPSLKTVDSGIKAGSSVYEESVGKVEDKGA